MQLRALLYSVIIAASIASIFYSRISIFITLLVVIALASLSRFESKWRPKFKLGLIVSLLLCVVAMARFIMVDALTGIVGARSLATNKKAVSMLREIYFAQDAFRRNQAIPLSGAELGAPALLTELSSTKSQRITQAMNVAPLASRFAPRIITKTGPAAALEGYLFLVCLPLKGGGFSATPGAEFIEEKGASRWGAYAWPGGIQTPSKGSYFINEREEILAVKASADLANSKRPEDYRFLGAERTPSCESAMIETREDFWIPWRGKKAKEKQK